MAINKDGAVENARNDLAKRLKIDAADIKEHSVEDADFPDMALGAGEKGEMSGQMITRGWRIKLEAKGQTYEYRADKNQVRAYQFKGKNYRI
jgi:plasmid stability protein